MKAPCTRRLGKPNFAHSFLPPTLHPIDEGHYTRSSSRQAATGKRPIGTLRESRAGVPSQLAVFDHRDPATVKFLSEAKRNTRGS